MTRLTTSTLTLTTAGVSAGLTAVFALLLTGTGQAESLPVAKPTASQTTQISVTAAPTSTSISATQLVQGRDGQRTVRVVYASPMGAR